MIQIVPATTSHIKAIQEVSALAWPEAFKDILSASQIAYMMEWMYSEASLRDAYAGVALPLAGGKAQAWYHDFRSDRGSYRYGREFDLSWERTIPQLKGLSVLLKAARYRSSDDLRTKDADKLWLQVQYSRM